MGAIILISNSANKGKSSTLVELANLILDKYVDIQTVYTYKHKTTIDFTLVIKVKGKTIAFESKETTLNPFENQLGKIIENYNPDIIFCTSKTKGATLNTVNHIVSKFNYNCIKTSTYQVANDFEKANQTKAKHLFYLAIQLDLF
nr:hypothetical protein [uncultured Flavobacterium sp.]